MIKTNHLFLTMSRGGWGEAAFGIHIARQLRQRGDNSVFLTHEHNMPLFSGGLFEHFPFGNHLGKLLWPLIEETARERSVSSIVMCDFLTSDGMLRELGVDAKRLRDLNLPIVAVDTWDHACRSSEIDIFLGKKLVARDWIDALPRLRPCPILQPSDSPGTCSFLPTPASLSKSVRKHVRESLGLSERDVAVLFCTANWQQSVYDDDNGQRTSQSFAALLANYFSELAAHVHLIHVGPTPICAFQDLGNRHHWLPPLGDRFDQILGSVELLLSANVSATTVSKAIVSQIPVLMLENSCIANTGDEAIGWLADRSTPAVIEWLKTALPLYPFRLWPLGFYHFLSPVLSENNYNSAMCRREWLDKHAVIDAIQTLSSPGYVRSNLQHSQYEYAQLISTLPSAADAFDTILGGRRWAA
jgi:hypothetical protein